MRTSGGLSKTPLIPRLSATTATPRQRVAGMALMLVGSASNQMGAAFGASAFPVIGPVGVVAVRQVLTGLILGLVVRPRFRGLGRAQWASIIGLALVFSVMNLSLYMAIDRIGLGLAVTLEFLGPLGVAIASSRKRLDLACAAGAAVGVVILTNPGPATDLIGIGLALIAAMAWAAYILLNRTIGQSLPGLQGTATAAIVAGSVWAPIGVVWFISHRPSVSSILLAVLCGLLASIVPYIADLNALRRVPTQLFSIFTSINPVWAVLVGWLILDQKLQFHEWVGLALIILSNVVVSVKNFPTIRRRVRSSSPL